MTTRRMHAVRAPLSELRSQAHPRRSLWVALPVDRNPKDLDEARIRPHLRQRARAEERTVLTKQQAAVLRAAIAENDRAELPRSFATAAGDSRKLRGIPAIGRSVAGAINGTNPEAQACRDERAA